MSYSLLFKWVVFFCCWPYTLLILYTHQGPKGDIVTIFSGILYGHGNVALLKTLFATSCILHLISLFRQSRLLVSIAFILWLFGCSLHLENTNGFDHNLILPTQFFFIFVLQTFFQKGFYSLQLFFISIHYFGSGITKLWESGLSWIDGVSLQMAVFAWGDPNDFFSSLIINNHKFALFSQGLILSLELLFPLVLFRKRMISLFFAMSFIGFHFINEMVFHYQFWSNIALLALVFIAHPFSDKSQEDLLLSHGERP